jgi:hypothetical protein
MEEMDRALGAFIREQNPYTTFPGEDGPPPKPKTGDMLLGPKWQAVDTAIENGAYALQWAFEGQPRQVPKALRIKYNLHGHLHHAQWRDQRARGHPVLVNRL